MVGMADTTLESNFGDLPMDIIEEIVLRLDPKSLVKFQWVNKHWFSKINNPKFMILHHKQQLPRTLLCFQLNDGMLCSVRNSENFSEISYKRFPIYKNNYNNKRQIKFVGSDNGVICWLQQYPYYSINLWNPAIDKCKKLPTSPVYVSCPYTKLYGIGYEPLSNDFKVVVACGGQQFPKWLNGGFFRKGEKICVYSLKTNSWKTIDMPDIFSNEDHDEMQITLEIPNRENSTVVNGSIHWAIYYSLREIMCDLTTKVVAFDLSSEEFKLIEFPSSLETKGFSIKSICNLFGCLSLLTKSSSTSSIEIWVMKEYGVWDSWTKYYSLDLGTQPMLQCASDIIIWEFGHVTHNGNLLFQPYMHKKNTLYFYDLKSKTLQNIELQIGFSYVSNYRESIFLS
ncbi:hypothetical protein CsatA_002431 [Cannabis sativa]